MKTLENKVVAITGAASGIGLALSNQCIELGAHLAAADIDKNTLPQVLPNQHSTRILRTTLDVSDERAVLRWSKQICDHFGRVDVIINNAGVSLSRNISQMSRTQLQRVMDINFYGVVNGVNAFLPYLQQQEDSHIVNVSSVFGLIGVPGQSAYNAAKFAVRGFTEALRLEMADKPINVSCVLPGGVKTNIVISGEHFDAIDGQSTSTEQLNRQFEKTARTSAEKAAQTIIKGILSNQQRILIGPDAKFIDRLQRWMPASYERILKPLINFRLQRMSDRDIARRSKDDITLG